MPLVNEVKRLAKFGHAPHCGGEGDDCNLCTAIDRVGREAYSVAVEKANAIVKKVQDAAAKKAKR